MARNAATIKAVLFAFNVAQVRTLHDEAEGDFFSGISGSSAGGSVSRVLCIDTNELTIGVGTRPMPQNWLVPWGSRIVAGSRCSIELGHGDLGL